MIGTRTRSGASVALAIVAGLLLAGCKTSGPGGAGQAQGWDAATRNGWYNADQGSRLMPLAWMRALEQPDGASGAAQPRPFLDPAYLASFRILPARPGGDLPIGFAVDDANDARFVNTNLHWIAGKPAGQDPVQWVGLTCAACHTAQMDYNGQAVRVDGGPSLFDFQSFIENLDKALAQTRDAAAAGAAGARWDRFARAVLGAQNDNPANRALLLAALNKLIDWEAKTEALNHTDQRYGYGRVDAIGHIFNRILLFGGAPQPAPNPADAAVSYPHLWNITKETQLQWDGVAQNAKLNIGATPTDYGAMGRNAGEVLGVFGEVVIKPPSGPTDLSGFDSSVNLANLNAIEVALTRLKPPAWPAAFGVPGQVAIPAPGPQSPAEVVAAGKTLFDHNCAACHTPQAHYETMKTFADLGPENLTDEWMACNAWADTGASGALTGIPVNYVNGDRVAASAPVRQLLETAVKGALVGQKKAFVEATAQNIFGVTPLPRAVAPRLALARPLTPKEQRLQLCMKNAANPLMAYKARPLEGIWATAPYLHNGSVPTLYDLLLPPAQRPKTFAVGTRDFDPRKVGYSTSPAAAGNSFTFDTSVPGNSNKGHVYGVGALSEAQRLELIEYLKTL
ncbi:MAG TPA: di-heme-cytochrome C peroxidase [Caulobacteraceae bacterium]|nr:di-heme-cytochrome C peroxidase [Caulobacteraceae bacterium]